MEQKHRRCGAIVLAAGKGSRMKSSVPKQFLPLRGKPVLYYSLAALEAYRADDIVLVSSREEAEYCRREIVEKYAFSRVHSVVLGGRERYHSVYAGLKELERLGYAGADLVLIHDGARPFLDGEILGRVCRDAAQYGACAAGMPSKDTVKLADAAGFAVHTPDRSLVWTVQTPQAFVFSLIRDAYERMMASESSQENVTDDAMVIERMTDCRVRLTEGSYRNMKITTPEDLILAEALMGGADDGYGKRD